MKKLLVSVVIAINIILFSQELEKKITDKYSNVLYPVRLVEKTSSFVGRGQEKEYTKFVQGLALKEDLIVISSSTLSGGDFFAIGITVGMRAGDGTVAENKKPETVYVVIDEKTECKAKLIGENSDLNIIYYKLTDETKKLNFLDINKVKESKLTIGENVYVLDKFILFKDLNFPVQIKNKKIEMVLEKPYAEYVIEGAHGAMGFFSIQPLALVFNSKGDFFGVLSLTQNAKKEEESGVKDISSFDVSDMMSNELLSSFLVIKPISFLQKVLTEIPTEIPKGWLGFFDDSLEFIQEAEAEEFLKLKQEQKGLRIASLPEGTPVYKSGLKTGDILLNIGDINCVIKDPKDINSIFEKLRKFEVGKTIKIKFIRKEEGGTYKENTIDVTTIEEPIRFENAEEFEDKKIGVRVKELTFDYKYKNKLSVEQKGLVTTFVKSGEPAAVGGIISSDILISISIPGENKENEINSIEQFKKLIDELTKLKPKEIIVKVLSTKETKFITLRNINW